MTKAKDGGYVSKRIADDAQEVCVENARLIHTALEDLLDGDADTSTAEKALNDLALNNLNMFALQSKVAGGNMSEAEALAMQIAAAKKSKP